MRFEMLETETRGTIIKVVGVGGAGGNAVAAHDRRGVQGVEFICANTDPQALARSSSKNILQLGRDGLGAGSRPEAGRAAAEEARDRIARCAARRAHGVHHRRHGRRHRHGRGAGRCRRSPRSSAS